MIPTGGQTYLQKGERVLRMASLLIPGIMAVYGTLIATGVLTNYHFAGIPYLIILLLSCVVLATSQLFTKKSTASNLAIRLIGFHVLAGGFLLFVSGLNTPFIATWILLILTSSFYFGAVGVRSSILWLIIVGLIDYSIFFMERPNLIISNVISIFIVATAAVSIILLLRTQEIDRSVLSRSQENELLQRDRLLTIINNLADAILSTDQHGTIRIYNASSLNLLDTNESLAGQNIDKILHLKDQSGSNVKLTELLKQTRAVSSRDDLVYTFDDGETMRIEAIFSPIRSSYSRHKHGETHDGYIVIMRDITKSKSLEEERDEFISVVSHELRTPITITEGTISNVQMMMGRSDIKEETLRGAIDMAHEQIVYLANMVNDLSTLSRAERGVADEAELIDVKEMVTELYKQYTPEAEAKSLHLNLDIGTQLGSIHVSRLYVEELLQNFITNALKYTIEGTVVLGAHQTNGQVTFYVKDSGIGISKPDQKKVFDKFYRSEDYRTRETGGTGLGLYVSAKLARKLGCHIELKSRLNHGSTFSFTLPNSK